MMWSSKPDVHQRERLLDALSDEFIGLAGLGNSRWMIVRDDHRGGIALQGQLHDLARVHAGAVDGAAKQLFELDQSMTFIEVQTAKHFVLEIAQLRRQEIAGRPRDSPARVRRAGSRSAVAARSRPRPAVPRYRAGPSPGSAQKRWRSAAMSLRSE